MATKCTNAVCVGGVGGAAALQIRAQLAALGCPLAGDTLYTCLLARWSVRPGSAADCEAPGVGCSGGAAAAAAAGPTKGGAADAVAGWSTGAGEEAAEAGAVQGAAVQEAVPWYKAVQEDPLKPLCLQVRLPALGVAVAYSKRAP